MYIPTFDNLANHILWEFVYEISQFVFPMSPMLIRQSNQQLKILYFSQNSVVDFHFFPPNAQRSNYWKIFLCFLKFLSVCIMIFQSLRLDLVKYQIKFFCCRQLVLLKISFNASIHRK